jgi:hypothetical protein
LYTSVLFFHHVCRGTAQPPGPSILRSFSFGFYGVIFVAPLAEIRNPFPFPGPLSTTQETELAAALQR